MIVISHQWAIEALCQPSSRRAVMAGDSALICAACELEER